jgi:dimeric dUTPase (all-alpha-NTP-PPase superfamily)
LSKLQKLLDKQKELDERIREDRDLEWDDPQDELADLCTAMIDEICELREHTNWKWWADDTQIDYSEAREELIDVLHFWLSAANKLGFSAESILSEYMDKHEENHDRQERGY